MCKVLIYHNPHWGKSRESVKILDKLDQDYIVVDYIKNDDIQMIINTPLGAQSRYDEYEIGKAAIKHNIPVFTTIAGAQVVLRAIRITLNKKLTYTSLQKIFT